MWKVKHLPGSNLSTKLKNKPISFMNDDQWLEVLLQTRWSNMMSFLIRLVDPCSYFSIVDPKRLPRLRRFQKNVHYFLVCRNYWSVNLRKLTFCLYYITFSRISVWGQQRIRALGEGVSGVRQPRSFKMGGMEWPTKGCPPNLLILDAYLFWK